MANEGMPNGLMLAFLLSSVVLVLTAMCTSVYLEYEPTQHYETTWCRPTGPLELTIKSAVAQGKIAGCVANATGQCIGKNVTLTYPPLPSFENTYTADTDVYAWASAVQTAPFVQCRVSDGVAYTSTCLYGSVAFGVMLLGYIYLAFVAGMLLCSARYWCQTRRARNEYSSLSTNVA